MLVESLLRLALLGASWVMYLLLGLSVVSIGVMLERAWFFYRYTERERVLSGVVHNVLAAGSWSDLADALMKRRTVEADILVRGLTFATAGATAFEHAMQGELDQRRGELGRGLNLLGTIGSNGPFVGLLGTVIGVIESFHHLGAGNDDAAMAAVMAGIAEALVATAVGLFVAIPAVVSYNYFSAKIDGIEESLRALTKTICAELEAEDRGVSVTRTPTEPPPSKSGKGKRPKTVEQAATLSAANMDGDAIVWDVD
jgi:biopolymer transport protein ExbB/biopolymer transport protein TolQ